MLIPCDFGLSAEIREHYSDLRLLNGSVCGISQFAFTWAIVVGLMPLGYERRYCFEHEHQARDALLDWDGVDHPGGDWIKCKGIDIDLLNPNLALDSDEPRPRQR